MTGTNKKMLQFRSVGELRSESMGETMVARVKMRAEDLARLSRVAAALDTTYAEIMRVVVMDWLDQQGGAYEIEGTRVIGGEAGPAYHEIIQTRPAAVRRLEALALEAYEELNAPALLAVGGRVDLYMGEVGGSRTSLITVKRSLLAPSAEIWATWEGSPVRKRLSPEGLFGSDV